MNKTNLLILADYLDKLPTDYSRFHMNEYAVLPKENDWAKPYQLRPATIGYECGAVCCAVGHGPAAGLRANSDEVWANYTERVFGLNRFDHNDDENPGWVWCFSALWWRHDNTPKGAACRIRYLVEHDQPPYEFDYDDTTSWHQFVITGATP